MHEQKHPKIYIAFLIFSLLLAALLFLTSATVYAVSSDYPREASEAASKPSAEENKAESSSASSENLQQLKQNAESQVQKAQSEQEVREAYHNFQKQAKQVKQQSAKETRQISKPKQRRAALTGRYHAGRMQNRAASSELKSTSRKVHTTSNHQEQRKKTSKKVKPYKKHSRKKIQVDQTSKKRIQTKTTRPKTAEERTTNNPYPALVMLSLFLSFAMIRLSVFGGNSGIEITFMELHKKEGGA